MQPLCIGMDYNANINWIVCGQPKGNRLNILKSFYVKFVRKIPALIADFCSYYAPHPNHTVIFYYDATALGSNYAMNDQDFHWVVVYEFERHGWQVIDVYLGNPMRRKTSSNTAPTAPIPSTPSTSAARNSHSTICTQFAWVG